MSQCVVSQARASGSGTGMLVKKFLLIQIVAPSIVVLQATNPTIKHPCSRCLEEDRSHQTTLTSMPHCSMSAASAPGDGNGTPGKMPFSKTTSMHVRYFSLRVLEGNCQYLLKKDCTDAAGKSVFGVLIASNREKAN